MLLKKIKAIFDKEELDYSEGYIDPLVFHRLTYHFNVAFQVLDQPNPWWTYVFKFYFVTSHMLALVLSLIGTLHGIDTRDLTMITQGGTYFIIVLYEMYMVFYTLIDLKHYYTYANILREDFVYVSDKRGERHRKRFFENQLMTWRMCIVAVTFIMMISVFMIGLGILVIWIMSIKNRGEEDFKRPSLLPIYLFNIDVYKTPVYEILLAYSSSAVFIYGIGYSFMLQNQIMWIRAMTTKVDLMIWDLEVLLDDIHATRNRRERTHFDQLLKKRMVDIVSMHQSMYSSLDHYASVYKKLSMFEQKLAGPVVCFTAYSSAEKLETGDMDPVLVLLCIATVVLVFIPSYLCTFLEGKILSIREACWDTKFWEAGPIIRPYLVLIMQRSLRPLPLRSPGFETVSIETFAKKMSGAYQMFNMLRQLDLDIN